MISRDISRPTSSYCTGNSELLSTGDCPTHKDLTASFKYVDSSGVEQKFKMWSEFEAAGGRWQLLAQELGYGAKVNSIDEHRRGNPHSCYILGRHCSLVPQRE